MDASAKEQQRRKDLAWTLPLLPAQVSCILISLVNTNIIIIIIFFIVVIIAIIMSFLTVSFKLVYNIEIYKKYNVQL